MKIITAFKFFLFVAVCVASTNAWANKDLNAPKLDHVWDEDPWIPTEPGVPTGPEIPVGDAVDKIDWDGLVVGDDMDSNGGCAINQYEAEGNCYDCITNGSCNGTELKCRSGYKLDDDVGSHGDYWEVYGNWSHIVNANPHGFEPDAWLCVRNGCPSGQYENSNNVCTACPENAMCDEYDFRCNSGYKKNSAETGCEKISTETVSDCPPFLTKSSDGCCCNL